MAKYYREVKASERLPDNPGEENKVIIRSNGFTKDVFGHEYSKPFVTYGFVNYDKVDPKFYFIIGHDTFLTNENIFWLEPVEEDVLVSVADAAWNECETWKGWVTQTELDKKKEQYINKLKESI